MLQELNPGIRRAGRASDNGNNTRLSRTIPMCVFSIDQIVED